MIIFGTRGVSSTTGSGRFYCPRCEQERPYHSKRMRRFFTLYFILTGLHGLHVVIGMTVLAVLMIMAWRGSFDHGYSTPMELGGMYWHLVDLIWIFLYPLLYLI